MPQGCEDEAPCERAAFLPPAAAVAVLIAGTMVVTGHASPAPRAATLSERLASATRVAKAGDGSGYWLVSSTGEVFTFGAAQSYGSMKGRHLNAPITGIVATADHLRYWLVAKDGGVFSFGDAIFHGSLGDKALTAPVVGMAGSSGGGSTTAGARGPTGPAGAAGVRGRTGSAGAAGATGATGTNGTNGNDGASGPTGPLGPTGPTGASGTNGTNGTTGATGATGSTGSTGGANYAYVYALIPQTVAINANVLFDGDGPTVGFVHVAGSSSITVNVAGTYRIDFSVSGSEPNQFGVWVNSAVAPSSIYGSGAGTQQNSGHVILTLAANDVLRLTNRSSAAAVTLASVVGGTQANVTASLLIEQLG
jgi:hypothetical protein